MILRLASGVSVVRSFGGGRSRTSGHGFRSTSWPCAQSSSRPSPQPSSKSSRVICSNRPVALLIAPRPLRTEVPRRGLTGRAPLERGTTPGGRDRECRGRSFVAPLWPEASHTHPHTPWSTARARGAGRQRHRDRTQGLAYTLVHGTGTGTRTCRRRASEWKQRRAPFPQAPGTCKELCLHVSSLGTTSSHATIWALPPGDARCRVESEDIPPHRTGTADGCDISFARRPRRTTGTRTASPAPIGTTGPAHLAVPGTDGICWRHPSRSR